MASSPGCEQIPQFLAGWWQEASVPQHVDFSLDLLECLHDVAAGFPQQEWSKKKQKKGHRAFYTPALEVTQHHFTIFSLLESSH